MSVLRVVAFDNDVFSYFNRKYDLSNKQSLSEIVNKALREQYNIKKEEKKDGRTLSVL